ncbi:uncharacterized protein si:cabz01007807.1 isoform X2 [Syngnathoides biaculeatus]|uniref:uncharacterized protein si:cabz01007807.1 isoform X2 n=1 Tax=Syngnathoides biaculeatus TaxID=300417 RepID=UPI002ADD4885|nr:uncharacterized protein si:cabz01007807.1 isoform X2 [Syngnathoides biaculeatus]
MSSNGPEKRAETERKRQHESGNEHAGGSGGGEGRAAGEHHHRQTTKSCRAAKHAQENPPKPVPQSVQDPGSVGLRRQQDDRGQAEDHPRRPCGREHRRRAAAEWSTPAKPAGDVYFILPFLVVHDPHSVKPAFVVYSRQHAASTNPFHSHHTEFGNKSDGGEDGWRKPWQEARADGLFGPPPGFLGSPQDHLEDGKAAVSEAQQDLVQAFSLNHVSDSYPTSQSGSASGQYHSINLNSPENNTENLFKNLHSKSSSMQDLLRDSPDDFSLKTSSGQLLEKDHSVFMDPLRPSSNVEENLFGSSKAPFYSASTTESHLFQANGGNFPHDKKPGYSGLSGSDVDVFSPSSDVSSPIVKELFRDSGSTSDLFGAKAANSKYIPGTLYGSGLAKSTSDLSESAAQSMYFDTPRDIVLTTPQGSKHGILQPTPFSLARNLSKSPDSSPTDLTHMKLTRRPPKPLPRSRPPRLEKPTMPEIFPKPANAVMPEPTGPPKPPPKPFKTLPKPVIDSTAKPQDDKALNQEDFNIFEDILLIGQEKCVEDWPEDSPQFHPDFKPSGKFRLRRESLKVKMDSEGRGEDHDDAGSYVKRKEGKFSLLSRGSSKDKFYDDLKDSRSWTLPPPGKPSKDYFYETDTPPAKWQDGGQSWSDTKKKPLKNKVNQLLRRASTSLVQRNPAAASKDDDHHKKRMNLKGTTTSWRSQEAMFGDGSGEEDVAKSHLDEADFYPSKDKKKNKMMFVPQKGFASSPAEQPQGAHGYTPPEDSKDRRDQFYGAADTWQKHKFEDVDEIKRLHSNSQDEVPDFHPKHQSNFPAEQLDDGEQNAADDYKLKKSKFKAPVPLPRKPKPNHGSSGPGEPMPFGHAARAQTPWADDWQDEGDLDLSRRKHGSPLVDYNYKQDDLGLHKQKKFKHKGFRKHKTKKKIWEGDAGDVGVEHLSEAAQAEWLAAQKDERAAAGLEEGDGDTDSLMEWWNTVEQWDELPSDDEVKPHLDESQSFAILADKVNRGLRMFNKVFTERAEIFWQHVVRLHALADHLATFHQKAKAAGITGSTTAAVGGVTAIAGLALAPFTFGASLIVTAVGVGVATAGGITSASASISDNVNNMQERKKVEAVLQEYESDFRDLARILHFVNHGLYKLRGHPFLRSGTQHYSEDWEVRKAVQMISLVDSPVLRAVELTDGNLDLVHRLQSGMDKYFKDSRELKKAFKKEVVARIKEVADMLNEGVVELNSIREELQKAIGNF